MSGSLTSGFTDAITGAKSFGAAMADTGRAVLRAITEMIVKLMVVGPLMRSFSGLLGFSDGGLVGGGSSSNPLPGLDASDYGPGYASGGFTGPGSKYQPAGVVHAGEYVFSQGAVNRIGVGNLDRLHRGYADGGYVPAPNIVPFRAPANTNFTPVQVQIGVTVDDDGKIQAYVKNQNAPLQKQINGVTRTVAGQGRAMRSAQRYQASGVS
jgi:lambda family phage tail tape measure protein